MGKGCLTDEQIQELVRFLDKTLTEHFTRQAARQGKNMLLPIEIRIINIYFCVHKTLHHSILRFASIKLLTAGTTTLFF